MILIKFNFNRSNSITDSIAGHSALALHSSLQSVQHQPQQPQTQHTAQPHSIQQSQQLNQKLSNDGQRQRGGQEILINGGQRSRQPRRHHTIASTEHFNNIMNQSNDHLVVS